VKPPKLVKCVLPAALLMFSAAIFTSAQDQRKNPRPTQPAENPVLTNPTLTSATIAVKVGDTVRGGETVIAVLH